jgi:hypothetical protein
LLVIQLSCDRVKPGEASRRGQSGSPVNLGILEVHRATGERSWSNRRWCPQAAPPPQRVLAQPQPGGLAGFLPWPAATQEQVLELPAGNFTHFDNVVGVDGDRCGCCGSRRSWCLSAPRPSAPPSHHGSAYEPARCQPGRPHHAPTPQPSLRGARPPTRLVHRSPD